MADRTKVPTPKTLGDLRDLLARWPRDTPITGCSLFTEARRNHRTGQTTTAMRCVALVRADPYRMTDQAWTPHPEATS